MRHILVSFLFAATSAGAEIPRVACYGTAPDWRLTITNTAASFQFENRSIQFEVPQHSRAEGRDWPLAITMVARNDTAIVVLEPSATGYVVDILTQRNTVPILLTGSCEVRE